MKYFISYTICALIDDIFKDVHHKITAVLLRSTSIHSVKLYLPPYYTSTYIEVVFQSH